MDAKLKFRPSDYSRWGTCTASPAATAGVKSERKSYADEGVIAHELLAVCLGLDMSPKEMINEPLMVKDIGSVVISAEMTEYIQESIDYIEDHTPQGWTRLIEQELDISSVIPGQKGVGDFIAFDPDDCTEVHLMDLKYGKGVKVYAENNGELMLHALGVLYSVLTNEQLQEVQKIVIHILQPRLSHYDRWEVSEEDLGRFANEAIAKYNEGRDPEKRQYVPSIDGCRFCPIKHDCRKLKESIYAKTVVGEDALGGLELKDPDRMSKEELAEMWEWFDFIGAWANNAKEHMQKEALRGVKYPGLKLIEGQKGNREWKDEQLVVAYLQEKGMADFEIYEQKLISPSKAETQLGKKNVGTEFKELWSQKKGSPKLVKAEHPGVAIEQARASEFDDIGEE